MNSQEKKIVSFIILLSFLIQPVFINSLSIDQIEVSDIDPKIVRDFGEIGKKLYAELNESKGELIISKWDNEVYFKIRTAEIPYSSNLTKGKTILSYQDYEARVYTIKEGIEFDIILKEKPDSNVFEFKIESKGLQFFYQPPLTEEFTDKKWVVNETHAFNDEGTLIAYRELKVVGSYAIYGFKQNNEYETGKVGHIYRPKIIDAEGSETYGELLINGSSLSITIPETWLTNAVYPVIIDPTFGKTDIGGSVQQFPTDTVGTTRANLTDSNINIFQFNIYTITSFGNPTDVKTGIYNSSAFLPFGLLGTSNTTSVGPLAWYSFSANINVSTPGDYYLAWNTDDWNIHTRYDTISQNTTFMKPAFGNGGLSFPDPFGTHGNNFTSQLSFFVNYTLAGVSNDALFGTPFQVDDLETFELNITIGIIPSTENFSRNILTIDPENLAINITYLNGTGFSELNDPSDYILLDAGSSSKDDISSTSFNLTYVLFIRPTITREGLFNVTSLTNETHGLNASDLFQNVFNLTIRSPPEPDLLYGAGFNASSPWIELRWNVSSPLITDFEIQNSSDGITFAFLDNTTLQTYNDTNIQNGTYRYHRVRARRSTGVGLKNSTFSNVNLEQVYFIRGITGVGIQNVTGEWIEYRASAINFTVGTHAGGDLNSTFDIDGNTWNHTEVVGVPGSVISINFTGVDNDAECIWVTIWYLYDGNLQHDFDIEMWNFTSAAWVDDGHIVDGVVFDWANSTIYALRIPLDFLSGGEVRVQLNHESPGNINHDLFIDYIRLVAKVPSDVEEEVFQFFWIVIALALILIFLIIAKMWFEQGDP